jgi:phosphoserine aminotransferase
MTRFHNFSAGPSALPLEVLEEAQRDLVDHPHYGMSVMETSHRAAPWVARIEAIEADFRAITGVSDEYAVLFVQGGASSQFAMVPLNLLPEGESADYVDTGTWSSKAIAETLQIGRVARVAASSRETGFDRIPAVLNRDPRAAYLHYTSNNTIYGTQWRSAPQSDVPLVCDASSDILSKPFDFDGHDVVYAGAQKNMGPAGVVVVVVRRDVLDRAPTGVPTMWRYKTHADKGSMFNTPPVFAIYMLGLVLAWVRRQGSLLDMENRNEAKAALIYDQIDASDFYLGHAQPGSRSRMNLSFRLPSEELTAMFLAEAMEHGMVNLKGHRSVGGCRASIYNAMPHESVEVLASFMADFAARRG